MHGSTKGHERAVSAKTLVQIRGYFDTRRLACSKGLRARPDEYVCNEFRGDNGRYPPLNSGCISFPGFLGHSRMQSAESPSRFQPGLFACVTIFRTQRLRRSEEHTSELQSLR